MPSPEPLAPLALPPGYSQRSLQADDAGAVAAVMRAQEECDVGEASIDADDISGDWGRPSFDIADSTVGVFEGESLVAYGEVTTSSQGDAAVHPDHRGLGLGSAIADWMQAKARSRGLRSIGMQVPQGSPSDVLLTALGYGEAWTAWDLALPAGAPLPDVAAPAGYVIRSAAPSEHEACCALIEDAFGEWADRERMTFADWAAKFTGRPGFAPWNLRVAVDDGGTLVGAATITLFEEAGFIEQLATRADRRGLGLGVALLTDAFAIAAAHGGTTAKLSTDSRTGALGLYERVGMRVSSTWIQRVKDLDIPT